MQKEQVIEELKKLGLMELSDVFKTGDKDVFVKRCGEYKIVVKIWYNGSGCVELYFLNNTEYVAKTNNELLPDFLIMFVKNLIKGFK